MPEIVPADRGKLRMLEERLEVAVDYVLGVQQRTLARGKNEPCVLVDRDAHPERHLCASFGPS